MEEELLKAAGKQAGAKGVRVADLAKLEGLRANDGGRARRGAAALHACIVYGARSSKHTRRVRARAGVHR